jgi:hypothetical protein
MFTKIVQVYPTDDYKVYLYFIDGKVKLFDASELVQEGIFKQLSDKEVFINKCTVINDTLAWDLSCKRDPHECLDLDPDELYEKCPEVSEPDIRTLLN